MDRRRQSREDANGNEETTAIDDFLTELQASSSSSGVAEADYASSKSTSSVRKHSIGTDGPAGKRLQKEMMTLARSPVEGVRICQDTLDSSNLALWKIELQGPRGTLYEGEKFKLQFKFGSKYPFDSPEVTFVGDTIPVHPHIYSNGHICLSILTEDWSPALSVESVCLSISSMLASAQEKKLPPDNAYYIRTCHKNPKMTRWWYHDDKV